MYKKKYYLCKTRYNRYFTRLNFEGLKSLIESITKQLWPQLIIASWDISYHIKRKKNVH